MTSRTGSPSTATMPPHPAAQRVTLAGVVRSEWTKLWTVRSTAWSLLVTVTLVVVAGVLTCLLRAANWSSRDPGSAAAFDPTAVSLTGVYLAQVAVGVLGALLVTGEYATGSIRTTFAAVPRRLPVLWGKVLAFAMTAPALFLPATLVAFLAGQSVLRSEGIGTSLGQPGVARAVVGSALFLTAAGILGLALGTLLRNTAAAVSALVGLVYVLPIMVSLFPVSVVDRVNRYLPLSAGTAITNVRGDDLTFGPWAGFGVFCLYTAVVLGLAAWRLRRGDA